ncbi:probable carboxylesterase 12 [Macadamia integrifolia]|uniref:probable carboxylesterase 12 n=1 Tax=Macadamia integrifolia TaxID=60698 RepID=UPI001C4F4AFB|nr:probable carboxylesterase 12 [Macadamia integrifolia]
MDSSSDEVAFYRPNFVRIYKDGRVERLAGTEIVPPTAVDPQTGISSKDVLIEPETGVSARLFLPKIITNSSPQKLPLLVYYHGGGFCIETPFSPVYNRYVSSLVAEANVVAVSVHYRRAPEDPLPIAYDDSWKVLQWVISHSKGNGPEAWLNEHADLSRVTMIGDSAGANIAHNMALRAAETPLEEGVRLVGLCLVHPYFHGENQQLASEATNEEKKGKADKLWMLLCPSSTGCDDPLMNPATCVNLEKLVSKRVLVCVAEKDFLKERGLFYHKTLGKSGWGGELELMEVEGEDHVFHLFNPTSEKAVAMMSCLASFLNRD